MPRTDGQLTSKDICNQAVIERILRDESVTSIKIAATIQSDNFATGTSGWQIQRDTGSAEFQDVTVRGSLNADDIDAGTLSADRIGAGTITAGKLTVGSFDNLIADPGFETTFGSNQDPHNYTNGGGTWSGTATSRSGGDALLYTVDSQSSTAFAIFNGESSYTRSTDSLQRMPAAGEGDQHVFEVYSRYATPAPDSSIFVRILYLDESGTVLATNQTDIQPSLTTAYQQFSVSATAPAGTASVEFSVAVNVQGSGSGTRILFDDAYARRKSGTTTIEDGAITTDKITASAVTADKVAAGTLTADEVKASSLSADVFNLGVGADNLIHNPGFDDDDTSTSPHDTTSNDGGGTFSYDSGNARGGSGFALEYDVAGQSSNAICFLNGGPGSYSRASDGLLKMPPASSGDRFLMTAFVKHNGTAPTQPVFLRILSVDAGGTVQETASVDIQADITSAYKRFTLFADVHPNTIYVEPSFSINSGQASGCKLYFENVVMRREIIPAGAVQWFAVPSINDIPAGWILCDGSAVSRTTYRTLFDTMGTLWGTGDGSTTFNVPDLLGQIMIGYAGGTGLSSGDTSGSWDHTHTGPSHSHSHDHSFSDTSNGPSSSTTVDQNADGSTVAVGSLTHTHDVSGTTGNDATAGGTGNTGSANPPVAAMVPAIKA